MKLLHLMEKLMVFCYTMLVYLFTRQNAVLAHIPEWGHLRDEAKINRCFDAQGGEQPAKGPLTFYGNRRGLAGLVQHAEIIGKRQPSRILDWA